MSSSTGLKIHPIRKLLSCIYQQDDVNQLLGDLPFDEFKIIMDFYTELNQIKYDNNDYSVNTVISRYGIRELNVFYPEPLIILRETENIDIVNYILGISSNDTKPDFEELLECFGDQFSVEKKNAIILAFEKQKT